MTTRISYDVRVAGDSPLQRTRAHAPVPSVQQWRRPFLDKLGEAVHDYPLPVAAGAVAGAVAGVKLQRWRGGGVIKPLLAGLGGAIAGAVASGAAVAKLRDDPHLRPPVPPGQLPPKARAGEPEKVKVMTWNVHGGMGGVKELGSNDGELDALAEVVRREQPDVLLLQELDKGAVRSNHTDVLRELAERLDPTSAVAASPGTLATGRQQHVGVLTFNGFRIDNARNLIHEDPRGGGLVRRIVGWTSDARKAVADITDRPIPQDLPLSYSPRNSIDTIVVTPKGTDMRVVSGHYSGPTSRVDYQAAQTLPLLLRMHAYEGPTLLGGDFNVDANTTVGRYEREVLERSRLTDTFESAGIFPEDPRRATVGSGRGIDRIYASDEFSVQSTRVVRTRASDHHAVVSDVTLLPPRRRD